jgi:pyruvate dehydrogenase E1 component alpha subunit
MWKSRDPITTFTTYLRTRGILDDAKAKEIDARIVAAIDDAVEFAMQAADPDPVEAAADLYA